MPRTKRKRGHLVPPVAAARSHSSSPQQYLDDGQHGNNHTVTKTHYELCLEGLHGMIQRQDTDFTTKRTLPNFNREADKEKGGAVIVFWHVAKTGGTTVRKQCGSLPGVDYMMQVQVEDTMAIPTVEQ